MVTPVISSEPMQFIDKKTLARSQVRRRDGSSYRGSRYMPQIKAMLVAASASILPAEQALASLGENSPVLFEIVLEQRASPRRSETAEKQETPPVIRAVPRKGGRIGRDGR